MSKPHNTHYMYTYIHTDYTYTHTNLQTNTYIHQYMHVHTDTPHPPTGGAGHTIHTHIHTYIQIHTYIHTCMYIQTRPPNPQGGRGKTTCPPYIQKPVHPDPLGGGGGWGLQTWTIYTYVDMYIYIQYYIHIYMYRCVSPALAQTLELPPEELVGGHLHPEVREDAQHRHRVALPKGANTAKAAAALVEHLR